jgi:enediyne biosynthesis protein E4
MFRLSLCFILWFSVLGICCSKKSNTLFELKADTGIDFENNLKDGKDFNIFSYRNFYNGGGVAVGDINNDSLPDVFFTANTGSNKLYMNKGNFHFEDISLKAGFAEKQKWSTGVIMVDLNADGWLDIYVCNAGYQKGVGQENELYINNKNGTFTECAKQYGLDDSSFTTHAAFFDYDLDGDLDCYLLNNSFIPVNTLNYSNKRNLRAKDWPVEEFIKGGGDKLLRNDNNRFVDVSEEAGIHGSLIGFGLGITVGDINGDHYPDMYISNDFFERDYLYINQRNGTFKEELEQRMQHISASSMGADIADINNDDYPDFFTTDMLPPTDYRLKTTSSYDNIDVHNLKIKQGFYHQYMQNTLQLNNKSGNFLETGYYSGVAASDWSWGGLIFDADNDGWSDLYVCNGIYHDVTDQDFIDFFADEIIQRIALTGEKEEVSNVIKKMPSVPIPNKAFKNNGNLTFTDVGNEWGFSTGSFSNGAAYGDLDNDGDLDLIVNNVNAKAFVYENHTNEQQKQNYIAVQLTGKAPNTFATGSKIKVYSGDMIISREVIPSRGFQSSCDYKQIIGLGNRNIDSLVIIWPDLSVTKMIRPGVNQTLFVKQTSDTIKYIQPNTEAVPLFIFQPSLFDVHQENNFIDFYYERNIPVMLSCEGPASATADVNGDGLTDIFIGGAQGQQGQLYLQTKTGFIKKPQQVFEADKEYEDVAAVFFDADRDGDLDLIVGSGGNNHIQGHQLLQPRLYINNGNGVFSKGADLPKVQDNTSVIIAEDIDGDGYEDLFIGGRNKPYSYCTNAASYLWLSNGNGTFTDYTKQWCSSLANAGIITDAVFADFNNDQKKDLILAGEWMPVKIFQWKSNSFEEFKTNLDAASGWWQAIEVADLDGDGDLDLVLGNYGENFYLKPGSTTPVKLFMNDFDNNSVIDKLLSKTVDGKDVPVFLKRELQEQIPSLKKQNLKHADYATKTIQTLFQPDIIKKAEVKQVNYSSSCIAWNNGKGNFTIKALPAELQLSSINAIVCKDVNSDGKLDLIVAGNLFNFLPQFSRLDASYGWVVLNKGNQEWTVLQQAESGLFIKGQVKAIREIKGPAQNNTQFLFLQNNDVPVLYRAAN